MAQGVPRPDSLPPGPVRTLVHALHDLYRDAGMPSMRAISGAIRKRTDLPDTVSHETVGLMLRGESVPGWVKFESVIRHLASIAVHRPAIEAEVARFHELWLAAADHGARQENSPPVEARAPAEAISDTNPTTESSYSAIVDLVRV